MSSTTELQPMQMARLDHTLEYAVVHSWDELMPNATSGLIHIEYHTSQEGMLEFVKIWASTIRGYWKLVCELWMQPLWSHTIGLRFSNGYHSQDLAHTLEFVIGHEDAFSKLPDQDGLIQVYPPTQEERQNAERWTWVAFNYRGSAPSEEPVAV